MMNMETVKRIDAGLQAAAPKLAKYKDDLFTGYVPTQAERNRGWWFRDGPPAKPPLFRRIRQRLVAICFPSKRQVKRVELT